VSVSAPFRDARSRTRRGNPAGAACALGLGVSLLSSPARAAPQWNAGVLASACLRGDRDDAVRDLAFYGAVQGDVLFARQRARDLGFGPYISVGTAAFDDLRVAGGARLLIPVSEDFPFVASAGALVTDSGSPGFDASLFFGVRSYNFHSSYNFGAGVVAGAQRTFGDHGTSVFSLGVQLDALVLALPFMLAWGALQ
jgi:hypothetical protein